MAVKFRSPIVREEEAAPEAEQKGPGTQVAKHDPKAAVPADVPSDPFLAMIREVATNKDLDVAKLEALLSMQERILDRTNKEAFDEALAMMQPELPVIDRKGRIEIREKDSRGERTGKVLQSTGYAKFEDIVVAIRPILQKHGFGLRFKTGLTADGRVQVVGILSAHGHREESEFVLQHDSTGSKNAVQAIGSSTSYGKRMATCALLNIVSRGEDDDGFKSGAPIVTGPVATAEQIEQVIDFAAAVECPKDRILDHLNKMRPNGHPEMSAIEDLPASRFDETIAALRSWDAEKKRREAARATQGKSK